MSQYNYYHQWLGIKPEDQPPTLYQLLGISEFESDPDVIRNATQRQLMHVRRLARGQFVDVGQALLNEIAEAKLTLLNEQKRDAYVAELRSKQVDDAPAVTGEIVNRKTIQEESIPAAEELPSRQPGGPLHIEVTRDRARQEGHRGWVIGYNIGCDFRLDCPAVSNVHCKFTWADGKLTLRDLNSTNGTFVNRKKLRSPQPVRFTDLVTLGKDQRIIFDNELFDSTTIARSGTFIFVGKGTGNELRIQSPSVSTYHAQLRLLKGKIFAIDWKSTNGTYLVDSNGKRQLKEPHQLSESDRLHFGDVAFEYDELYEKLITHQNTTIKSKP